MLLLMLLLLLLFIPLVLWLLLLLLVPLWLAQPTRQLELLLFHCLSSFFCGRRDNGYVPHFWDLNERERFLALSLPFSFFSVEDEIIVMLHTSGLRERETERELTKIVD